MLKKIPNILTIGRIIIVPFFVLAFYLPGFYGDLTALILLRFYLKSALDLLKIADEKMNQCAENLELEEISAELLAIQNQEIEDGNPVVTNVNGFDMGVQPVPKTEVGSLIKRQAIAKDSKGVIVLKGEPSFSASDQILIDELAFYITNNNLKA